MSTIKTKGYEIEFKPTTNSFSRRAMQFKNNILSTLKKFGLTDDDCEISMEKLAIKRSKAFVEWYMEGYRLYYSYNKCNKFVDNLYVVSKVLETAVNEVLNNRISIEEFCTKFEEDENIEEKRKNARKLLGVEEDSINMEEINKNFKDLARKAHPDVEGGCVEKFKEINSAHKILKRELE